MASRDTSRGSNGTSSNPLHSRPSRLVPTSHPPDLAALDAFCTRTAESKDYPLATEIECNIPIYDLPTPEGPRLSICIPALQKEWYRVLLFGPGVFIIRNFCASTETISATNAAFDRIIAREKASNAASKKGDHFAAGGKNDRIWNSFSKHCLEDSESFVSYYSNPWLHAVCEAWLGPGYRVTAQANIVRPGGAAQTPHRDYHLGFQTAAQCARYPKEMQVASQLLTLQGAVAHVDMPELSGPTRFLPFSQLLEEGYLAYRSPEVADYFEKNWVALPLSIGDAVFFNPALIHAAGENKTEDVQRSANLLQISSAFGKTMESLDSIPLVHRCWDEVRRRFSQEWCPEMEALVAALVDGYPFPTNLDRRPPAPGGMAPESEQDLLARAFVAGWDTDAVVAALRQMRQDSLA